MAVCNVAYLTTPLVGSGNVILMAETTSREDVAIDVGSNAASATADDQERIVRLCADTTCRFRIGASPTALTTDERLPADAIEYRWIQPGQSVAVIAEA